MNMLRKILFPFSAIYGAITQLRNYLYNNGYLKSYKFDVPIIVVGNLSVGGTGKTPQIEYLIRLLSSQYRVATLSRGYKRKSKGFVLANQQSNAEILGDEPYQFFLKFPKIRVAVDADRVNGIENLLALENPPQVILLDDAFQHRRLNAGFYILLSTYHDLYADDFILPTGNLRESRRGAKRADVIIITKCPSDMSFAERQKVLNKIKPHANQQVFFSYTEYDENVYSDSAILSVSSVRNQSKILLAGIAKPMHFFDTLYRMGDQVLKFSDHHHFTEKEILNITENLGDKLIITTEKDFVRLNHRLPVGHLYYLPIKSEFIEGAQDFNQTVFDYLQNFNTSEAETLQ